MRSYRFFPLGIALFLLFFSCASVPGPAAVDRSEPEGLTGAEQLSAAEEDEAPDRTAQQPQGQGSPREDGPVIASLTASGRDMRKAAAEPAVAVDFPASGLPLPELPLPELPPSPGTASSAEILLYPPPVIVQPRGRMSDEEEGFRSLVLPATREEESPGQRESPPPPGEASRATSPPSVRQPQPPASQEEELRLQRELPGQGEAAAQGEELRLQRELPGQSPAAAGPQPSSQRDAVPGEPIQAAVGEDLTITLDGGGWLFLGSERSDPGRPAATVRFLNRTFVSGKSRFLFSISSEGETLLRFQNQDTSAGTSRTEVYLIDVALRPRDREEQAALDGATQPEIAALETALRRELQEGAGAAAYIDIAPLLERYSGGEERESLTELSGLLEQWDGLNTIGLADFSLMKSPGTEDLPSFFLSASFPAILGQKKSPGSKMEIISFLEWLLPAVPENLLDSFYFRLGMLYEEDPPPKDPGRAVFFYEKIRLNLPWSRFWSEAAQRERFLRRHFLEFR